MREVYGPGIRAADLPLSGKRWLHLPPQLPPSTHANNQYLKNSVLKMVITFTGKNENGVCRELGLPNTFSCWVSCQIMSGKMSAPKIESFVLELMDWFYFSWQQQQESELHNSWDHLKILSSSYCYPCVWWVTVTEGAVIASCCDNSPSLCPG